MIETVYSKDNGDVNQTNRVQSTFKMPKNIRQVGKTSSLKKIYVEDYVLTFIKQLVGEDYSKCKVAVLIGHQVNIENDRGIFVVGAIEVENIDTTDSIVFTNDIWTAIYDNVKKYFIEGEIVGWFLGGPGYQLEDKERIRKTHIDNFAGQDKTLLLYDNMEKEEAFLLYQDDRLVNQGGFYIYYEKNEEMQTYMIDHNKQVSVESVYEDRVSKEMRTIIQNKKPVVESNGSANRLMYAAGTLLAVIILVVGAAMLSNYDQMKTMQEALDSLSQNLVPGDAEETDKNIADKRISKAPDASNIVDPSEVNGEGQLDVNILSGDIDPIKDEQDLYNEEPEVVIAKPTKKAEKKVSTTSSQKEVKETVKDESKHYTVASGDSLAGIAYKLYNSANYISIIKELNGIEDENMIYIGQKLIVP